MACFDFTRTSLAGLQAKILLRRRVAVRRLQDRPYGAAEPPMCRVEQSDAYATRRGKSRTLPTFRSRQKWPRLR